MMGWELGSSHSPDAPAAVNQPLLGWPGGFCSLVRGRSDAHHGRLSSAHICLQAAPMPWTQGGSGPPSYQNAEHLA